MSPTAPAGRAPSAPLYRSLFFQVVVALLLGIVIGSAAPDLAGSLKILSDGFLKLISMIVAPIVFCVVVHGIAGAGDLRKVGRSTRWRATMCCRCCSPPSSAAFRSRW
jgi:aerobic C4-dicarboxylate transport protein